MEKNMETTIVCWGYIGLYSTYSPLKYKLLQQRKVYSRILGIQRQSNQHQMV